MDGVAGFSAEDLYGGLDLGDLFGGFGFGGGDIFDRMFGTCVDGEAEKLGMEGGRRMDIGETMHFPFSEGYKTGKEWLRNRTRRPDAGAEPAE